MEEKVLDFLHRRFPEDNHWLDGNCFWMAQILANRFDMYIFYDPIKGHFFAGENEGGPFFDWSGRIETPHTFIKWDLIPQLDENWYKRLVRDCVC